MAIKLDKWLGQSNSVQGYGVSRGSGRREDGIQVTPETKEQKVIRMLKGDFERYVGMPYSEFEQIRDDLMKNNPEKLI